MKSGFRRNFSREIPYATFLFRSAAQAHKRGNAPNTLRPVIAPIGHDRDNTATTLGAKEAAALGDRREGRSILNACRLETNAP